MPSGEARERMIRQKERHESAMRLREGRREREASYEAASAAEMKMPTLIAMLRAMREILMR